MSNLSVRIASEAAIGIATLRHFASTTDGSPRIDEMAAEIFGDHGAARTIRTTIHSLAEREAEWIKERATHATISTRVNERRERELASIVAVHAATLTTLQLSQTLENNDASAMSVLQESYVGAIEGIDKFPMGAVAKQALHAQFISEAELAVPANVRDQVSPSIAQAEQTYLRLYSESVYSHYDKSDNGTTPSM